DGIGRAIASRLVSVGAKVIINGRNEDKISQVISSIRESQPNAVLYGIAADLSDAKECEKLICETNKLGELDVLVNNLGIFELKDFFEVQDEEWDNFWNVNVMSSVRLARGFLKGM